MHVYIKYDNTYLSPLISVPSIFPLLLVICMNDLLTTNAQEYYGGRDGKNVEARGGSAVKCFLLDTHEYTAAVVI